MDTDLSHLSPLYKADDKAFETGLLGSCKLAKPDPRNPNDKNTRWTFAKSETRIFTTSNGEAW
jgi:hypothetical protein